MSFEFFGYRNNFAFAYAPFASCGIGFAPYVPYGCGYYNPFSVFNAAVKLFTGGFENERKPLNRPFFEPSYSLRSNPITFSSAKQSFNSLYDGSYYYQPQVYTAPSVDFGSLTLPKYEQNDSYRDLVNALSYKKENSVSNVKNYSANIFAASTPKTSYKSSYTTLRANHLNKEFLNKVKTVARNLNCDYEDLLAVMNSESSLNPSATHKNRRGQKTAVGLIQFTKSDGIPALNQHYGLNLTVEKIEKMSAMEQLDLVEKFYKITTKKFGGRKLSAADLYASAYLPARAQNEILCRKGERYSDGRLKGYYESNSAFDKNGDNKITKSELNQHLAGKRVNLETFV